MSRHSHLARIHFLDIAEILSTIYTALFHEANGMESELKIICIEYSSLRKKKEESHSAMAWLFLIHGGQWKNNGKR